MIEINEVVITTGYYDKVLVTFGQMTSLFYSLRMYINTF